MALKSPSGFKYSRLLVKALSHLSFAKFVPSLHREALAPTPAKLAQSAMTAGKHAVLLVALATIVSATLEQDDPRFQWSTASAQTATHHGDAQHPTVRYSHDAVVWNDQMVVTHGASSRAATHRPAVPSHV